LHRGKSNEAKIPRVDRVICSAVLQQLTSSIQQTYAFLSYIPDRSADNEFCTDK